MWSTVGQTVVRRDLDSISEIEDLLAAQSIVTENVVSDFKDMRLGDSELEIPARKQKVSKAIVC